jgi:hypothetical protein
MYLDALGEVFLLMVAMTLFFIVGILVVAFLTGAL